MKKVLILEDEVSIRSFVVINLQRAGYDVIEAGTGEEALDQLRKNPDTGVAIFDINLPGMDGFEVCRTVRATNKSIGIIMLTARTQEMDKVTGFMTGADDYVTKPFSPAELTEPHPGKGRREDPADPGGVLHREAVHAESRPCPVPGGHSGCGLGPGLRRRAEDRGREHPAPAHQDRGRHLQSRLHYHRMGLRL